MVLGKQNNKIQFVLIIQTFSIQKITTFAPHLIKNHY